MTKTMEITIATIGRLTKNFAINQPFGLTKRKWFCFLWERLPASIFVRRRRRNPLPREKFRLSRGVRKIAVYCFGM
jgi:hypothetical protein